MSINSSSNAFTTTASIQTPTTQLMATTSAPLPAVKPSKFAYPVAFIATVWVLLGFVYLYSRWRQRTRAMYIIPRVFVLCSPRTVQFHYELILRVGLPSPDYNPDRHNIDLTVQGQQRNEVVPMTRLNTRTLLDEPLITSLSMIVYRLVEMPPLGSLVLRHSGPSKAWVFVYDFTVIDLSTNKEQYYTINRYMSSLNRIYPLDEHTHTVNVHYPIDDVPPPSWSIEDIFLILFSTGNSIMLTISLLKGNCELDFKSDVFTALIASIQGFATVFFLEWLLYYYSRWSQDRQEYFNLTDSLCCGCENVIRFAVAGYGITIGLVAVFLSLKLTGWNGAMMWLLSTFGACATVTLLWSLARQLDISQSIIELGLKLKGVESVSVGMRHTEVALDFQTKSGSASNDGVKSALTEPASKFASIGPRSSVKTFGFETLHARTNNHSSAKLAHIRHSTTGATPDQRTKSQSLRRAKPPSLKKTRQ